MNQAHLLKNRLDLEYKYEAQKANIFLTFGTITFVGFLAAMISQQRYVVGTVLGAVLIFYSFLMQKRSQIRMRRLLSQIENLSLDIHA